MTLEFPTRRKFLIAQLASNALMGFVLGLAIGLIAGQGASSVGAGVAGGLAATVVSSVSIRKRKLLIDDDGLLAQRNGYRLRFTWDDIEGFAQSRFLGRPISMLRLRDSHLEGNDGAPLEAKMASRIDNKGANRAVQISVYVEDPKAGLFGEHLRLHRPDLI
jgi:hypothetical protein